MLERESLQQQLDTTKEESNRLAEGCGVLLVLLVELKLARLRSATQEASPIPAEGTSLSVMLREQPSNEQSLKEKIRLYIVENSELRIRLQKQEKHFEEVGEGMVN